MNFLKIFVFFFMGSVSCHGETEKAVLPRDMGADVRDSNTCILKDVSSDLFQDKRSDVLSFDAFDVRNDKDAFVHDDGSAVSMLGFSREQRRISDQIISIFENGTPEIQYDYAEHLDDNRGITAGRAGFTSATGDMLIVIEKYTFYRPDNQLKKYREELKRLERLRYHGSGSREENRVASASVANLDGLIAAWQFEAQYKEFRDAQDEVVAQLYLEPAFVYGNEIGLTYPLSLLCLYDANIQHGEDGMRDIGERVGKRVPIDEADEVEWLFEFNQNRRNVLLSGDREWRDSAYRVKELDDIISMKNYQLHPFTMVIEDWGGERFLIPTP